MARFGGLLESVFAASLVVTAAVVSVAGVTTLSIGNAAAQEVPCDQNCLPEDGGGGGPAASCTASSGTCSCSVSGTGPCNCDCSYGACFRFVIIYGIPVCLELGITCEGSCADGSTCSSACRI